MRKPITKCPHCGSDRGMAVRFKATGTDIYSFDGHFQDEEIIEYCKENNIRTAMVTMNDSEYLKKSVTYYFLLPMLSIYNPNNNKNFHRIDNRSIFNIFIEILISFYTPQ